MNIPKRIKIGGHIISVTFSNTDTAGNMGAYNYGKQLIVIDSLVIDSQKEETFMHEVVEAINLIYEFNLPHDKIQILGAVLHQVIKDNPKVFSDEKRRQKRLKGKAE